MFCHSHTKNCSLFEDYQAHRDLGQQKAALKEDKEYFRRNKEERKQSFLDKCADNRGLAAAVTHLYRSGFMLPPVPFMLAL